MRLSLGELLRRDHFVRIHFFADGDHDFRLSITIIKAQLLEGTHLPNNRSAGLRSVRQNTTDLSRIKKAFTKLLEPKPLNVVQGSTSMSTRQLNMYLSGLCATAVPTSNCPFKSFVPASCYVALRRHDKRMSMCWFRALLVVLEVGSRVTL